MSNTRVYVGGLSHRCRESDLERFFRKYGRLREIAIKNGYAFVDFDDGRDADDAVYDLNGVDFMGDRVTVEFAKGTPHGSDRMKYGYSGRSRSRSRERGGDRGGRGGGGDRDRDGRDGGRPVWLEKYGPPTRTDYRVVVENLSSRVSWQDLKDFMRTAGEVTYADAHKNRKNEGVVEFSSRSDLKRALDKLDDTELNGRRIKLVDVSKKGGSRSRSRSRSGRGRSRSRSRSKRSRSRSKRSRSRSKRSRSRSGRSKKSKSASGGKRSRSRSKSSKSKKSRSRSGSGRSRSRSAKSRSRSEKSRSRESKKDDSDKD